MKGRTIILDHLGDIEAAALMVNGQLEDLLVDTPDAARVGTIYRAIADRPVKGQGGMFLKTPDGSAFLRQIKAIGAQASRGPRLSRGQLRRLEQTWPCEAAQVNWDVLVVVGQRAP